MSSHSHQPGSSPPLFVSHNPGTSSSSLQRSFPLPATHRFVGDGVDHRRPVMSTGRDDSAVIDLTQDSPGPARSTGYASRPNAPHTAEIIDVDELPVQSEVQHLYTRPRHVPQPQPVPDQRPAPAHHQPYARPHAMQGRLPGFQQLLADASAYHDGRLPHHLFGLIARFRGGDNVLEYPQPPLRDFPVPEMDYQTAAFALGDPTPPPQPPPPPRYSSPPPAREGFTRSPGEDDVVVCPNCEDELGAGGDALQRQIWVIRSCGHVWKPTTPHGQVVH